jgi:hypothetical protein
MSPNDIAHGGFQRKQDSKRQFLYHNSSVMPINPDAELKKGMDPYVNISSLSTVNITPYRVTDAPAGTASGKKGLVANEAVNSKILGMKRKGRFTKPRNSVDNRNSIDDSSSLNRAAANSIMSNKMPSRMTSPL